MQHRSDGERGQVIIVAALVIAAVFVGLALVLNAGIYAENLSSRETTDAGDPLTFSSEADRTVAEAYERTNAAGETTAADANATFNGTVDDWAGVRERQAARRGTVAALERTPHAGWRLEQSEDRSFTSAAGADDWRLAEDADGVAAFELNVTRDDLYDANGAFDDTDEEAFHVRVDNGTDEWDLYVFRDSSNDDVVVHAGDPGAFADLGTLRGDGDTCTTGGDRAVIDLRAEELDGSTCQPLNFSDDLSGSVDVYYNNATDGAGNERINGTYTLVVNGSDAVETDAGGAPTRFNAPGDPPPTAQAVVYSASYTTDYRRADIRHLRDVHYAPREESYRGD